MADYRQRNGPRSSRSILTAILVTLLVLLGGFAADPWDNIAYAGSDSPVGPRLTPKLRDLLQQEMGEMIVSANAITTALVTGDHATVADRAAQIVNGFILKRSLTEQDKTDLENAVPPSFLELDATFHQIAAKLVRAAQERDPELEHFYFSNMLEKCVICHSRYASDKFSGFAR
jgi:hypothetical protein